MICNLTQHIPLQEIDQSISFDFENNAKHYLWADRYPTEKEKIDGIFKREVNREEGPSYSLTSLLQSNHAGPNDLNLFRELGFEQLGTTPETGVILKHSTDFPGWLIKKNYGFLYQDAHLKRIAKAVNGSDFPDWMLPSELKKISKNRSITISAPNDVINSLRVVMLDRGDKWIKKLKLRHIKTANEYLYFLPDAKPEKPLHERLVVFSKEEKILDSSASLHRYVNLARSKPDKLKQIVNEIVLFIQHLRLTDNHLDNFPFLKDECEDIIVAIDGEPIGGLADTSIPDMAKSYESYDPSFYSLLGLKELKSNISKLSHGESFTSTDINKVKRIFNDVIDAAIQTITQQRIQPLRPYELFTRSPFFLNLFRSILNSTYLIIINILKIKT